MTKDFANLENNKIIVELIKFNWFVGCFVKNSFYFFLPLFCFCSFNLFGQEICDNGIDDNNNGLIDLQDTAFCKCALIVKKVKVIIPNPSFEEKLCCPTSLGQTNCVKNWVAASAPTTDYCNKCGNVNFGRQPIPDGDGYIALINQKLTNGELYKEYIGACLIDTFFSGIEYQLSFSFSSPSGEKVHKVSIFGNENCSKLPFGKPTDYYLGCPLNSGQQWILLDTVSFSSIFGEWTKSEFKFTPKMNITSIIIGPSCIEPDNYFVNYYFLDNLILVNKPTIPNSIEILSLGKYCEKNLKLFAKYNKIPKTIQWYRDSIAIIGAIKDTLEISFGDKGIYQVKAIFEEGCILSKPRKIKNDPIKVKMEIMPSCSNGTLLGSLYIKEINNGKPPYLLKLNTNLPTSNLEINYLDTGNYNLSIKDADGCIYIDSFKIFSVDCGCNIFIPTAFTPNLNYLNELFLPIINCEFKEFYFKIFNRWGEKIFESHNQTNGWDGKYQDKLCQEGVYYVSILLIPKKGERLNFSSTLNLLN